MSEIKLNDSFFSIENSPYLNKKRNLSLTKQLSPNNSPNKTHPLFKVDSTTIYQNEITESKENMFDKCSNITGPAQKKGKWSEEEDNLLIKYVNKFGVGKWNKIERYLIGRSRKQIRQRYISNIKIKKISEEIKQNISCNSESSSDDENEEKDILKKLQNENKNKSFKWDDNLDKILLKEYILNKKSWVKISKKIPGSSENSVKNRFYSLLRQKVNKLKKEYKYINKIIINNNGINNNNNNLILSLKKELSENEVQNNNYHKEILFNNEFLESEYFNNKSKKKNYSVEILLEFLPDLLKEKGININEILNELNERKNIGAKKIFVVIEKHFDSCKKSESNDYSSISTDIEFESLQIEQSEKLGKVIKNMKLKIMYKYFHRFRYNTLGI